MKNSTGIILGVAITLIATLLGILIALLNTPLYYIHSEIIEYQDGKTYIEEYHVKQSIGRYITSKGLIEDKDLIEFNKIEIEVK